MSWVEPSAYHNTRFYKDKCAEHEQTFVAWNFAVPQASCAFVEAW